MILLEVLSQPFRIVATKRFIKNAAVYTKGYPGVEDVLRDFLEFKRYNPTEQFGKKDTMFTGGALKNIRHVHLYHGKVILVYGLRGDEIMLYDMVEHNAFERNAVSSLASYIEHLSNSDFTALNVGPSVQELSPEEKEELTSLFWHMGEKDRDILEKAVNGDIADLMEFCRLAVDAPDDAIIAAMGGREGITKAAKVVLTAYA